MYSLAARARRFSMPARNTPAPSSSSPTAARGLAPRARSRRAHARTSRAGFPDGAARPQAFGAYARYTEAANIFGAQIRYLHFFGPFYETDGFVWALLGVFALAFLYLICKARAARATRARAVAFPLPRG